MQVESEEIDANVIVQLFSPMVASQRIMFCQFDNSYTSIQLEDDLNFVFEEVTILDLSSTIPEMKINKSIP